MAGYVSIVSEVIQRVGGRTDLDSRAPIWVNDAYMELLLNPLYTFYEIDATALPVTQIGDPLLIDTVAIGDFWFILDVVDQTNSRKLKKTDWSYVDKLVPTSGQPVKYYRFGSQILVHPTPSGSFQFLLRYRRRPAELSSLNPDTLLGREWDEVLTLMATQRAWQALDAWDKSQAQVGAIQQLLSTRQDLRQLEDEDSETTIGPGMEGWNG